MAKSSGKPRGDESTTGVGVVIGVFVLFAYLMLIGFWQAKHALISTIYGYIRIVQGYVFYLIGYIVDNPFSQWVVFFMKSDAKRIQFAHLMESSVYFNVFGIIFFVIPSAFYIWRVSVRTNPTNEENFAPHKDYTPASLCKKLEPWHPHLILWRKFNPESRPINEGPFRMPDTSKQFVMNNRALNLTTDNQIVANPSRARQVFIEQLGRKWAGIDALTKWERVVVAICAARLVAADERLSDGQFQYAVELQDKIQYLMWVLAGEHYSSETDSFDFELPEEVQQSLDFYVTHEAVQSIIKRHAYVYTAIYALVIESRGIGIFAHCQVGWLAIVDRRFNILVNTAGRGVPFTETSAIHAHYLWEVKMGEPIVEPKIEKAIQALEHELAKFKPTKLELEEAQRIVREDKLEKEKTAAFIRKKMDQQLFLGISSYVTESGSLQPLGFTLLNSEGQTIFHAICTPDEMPSPDQLKQLQVTHDDLYESRPHKAILDEIATKVANSDLYTVCAREIDRHAKLIKTASRDRIRDMSIIYTAVAGAGVTLNDAFFACNMQPSTSSMSMAALALQLYHKYPEARQQVHGLVS